MTTTHASPTAPVRPHLDRTGCLLLALGGVAFFAYGPLHPTGSDEGDKTAQLHSMLVDTMWYPAHAAGVLAFSAIAAGLLLVARGPGLSARAARVIRLVGIATVVMTLGQVIHTLAGTQASEIAGGETTPLVAAFMGVETLVNPLWSLAIVAVAAIGGLTGTLGNRIVLGLGVVGGLAFALANATIAFTDTFDVLFPVAGLIGLWAIACAVIGLTRR